MVNSINLICCVCVNKSENLKRVVEADENGVKIFDMLSVCTPLQQWSTDFQICKDCLLKLQEAHAFIIQCINSEELRENLIQDLELDIKVEDKWLCQYCYVSCATKQSLNRHKLRKHKTQVELQKISIKKRKEKIKLDEKQEADESKLNIKHEFAENECPTFETSMQEELNETKPKEEGYECELSDQGPTKIDSGHVKQENLNNNKSTDSSNKDQKKRHCCEQCGESFTTLASVRRHFGRKHTKSQKQSNSNTSDQLEHNKSLSQENILEDAEPSLNKPANKLMSKNGPFKCPHCDEMFNWEKELSNHKYKAHLAERPFQCNKCIARFSKKANLIIHLKERHKNKVFVCDQCNKRCDSQAKLTYHISTKHLNKREFQCELCGKNYNTKPTLLFHKRVVHTDQSKFPHVCNICSKRFALKNGLDNHIRRHMGIKEFICHICSKCFIDNHDLKKHLISHQALEERPSFACSLCSDKSFKSKDGLKAHLARIHSIGKKYPEYRNKDRYSCALCPKAFPTKDKLQTHFCSHTGDRPYVCEHCGKGFTDKYQRKKHVADKHQLSANDLLAVSQEVAVFGKNQFEDDDPVISYLDSKENDGF